ncbi:MAG: hypothetical protein NVSMB14_09790 [Isosphaeraceae bacterium]
MKYRRTALVIGLLSVAIGLGWNYGGKGLVLPREDVTVQFRRDALGGADRILSSYKADRYNGVEVSVRGKIVAESPEWLVLETKNQELWIPITSILLVSRDVKP